jgi:hypothetical protein
VTEGDYRVIVCGSRGGLSYPFVAQGLGTFDREVKHIDHVIVGSFRGVDREAHTWAVNHERVVTVVSAAWSELKEAAGPLRNERMAYQFNPSAVLAFPGGPGTANMKKVARLLGLPLYHYVSEQSLWIVEAAKELQHG